MNDDTKQATPNEELRRQITSRNEPKNEREWWALKEIERLTAEVVALKEQLAAREEVISEIATALSFYADPETYFAIGFFPDPPNGDFMNDFSETALGEKPGKLAREIIEKHVDVTLFNLREHEARLLEEMAGKFSDEAQPGYFYPNAADKLRREAAARRTK